MKNIFLCTAAISAVLMGCTKDELGSSAPRSFKAATTFPANFNASTGVGFVGKGDVQLRFGWNNKQLQEKADSIYFRVATDSVWEHEWSCTNSKSGNTVFKSASSKRVGQVPIASVARVNKQCTGFNLTGYGAIPPTLHTTGTPAGNCGSSPNVTASAVSSSLIEASTKFQVKVGVHGTYVDLY
jgi:hypothetical protein